jgi:hypothetical protein
MFVGGAKAAGSHFRPQQVSMAFTEDVDDWLETNKVTLGLTDANTWTVVVWYQSNDDNTTDNIFDWRDELTDNNYVQATITAVPSGVHSVRDSAGATIDFDTPGSTSDAWEMVAISWNGTTMDFYKDASNTKTSTPSGTMTDGARSITLGREYSTSGAGSAAPLGGFIHSFAIWDGKLTDAEVLQLWLGGRGGPYFDLNQNGGDYVSAADLKVWFRVGQDSNDIGKNWARNPAAGYDLMDNQAGMSASDLDYTEFPGA